MEEGASQAAFSGCGPVMTDRKGGWGGGISVKGKDKRPYGSFKAGALCGNGVCGANLRRD